MKINFTLNTKPVSLDVLPNRRLLDLLRGELGLTGTKEGCGIGECGACTVLINGNAVNSCLVLAVQVDGADVLTVEGLSKSSELNILQNNFLKHGAVQCGFCTPGILISAYALILKNPSPTEDEIKDAIAGNLCRCTGYKQIIEAIKSTAESINIEIKLHS
jgi:aerobic carbon-monoxide dehydrogenase small subunit